MTTLVLADDHSVVRQGLRALLEKDFDIVGEASDGFAASQLVERVKPDVLLLDLMMGSMNGFDVARLVRKSSPNTAVAVLSMYASEAYVLESLRAGARAYILKESSAEQLVHGIREAAAGRRYISPPLSERAIEHYMEKIMDETVSSAYETLTSREREILHLVVEGITSSQIAHRLFIAPHTVDLHRSNMMRKLGIKTHIELLRYAMLKGIIPALG